MRIATAKEMREIDQRAMEQFGIPGVVLMENAGLRVVEVIQELFKEVKGKVFSILVGKGNNGGDGLVVARHLHNRGAQVKVLLLADPEEFQGDARINLTIWQRMGQPLHQVHQINGINMVKVALLNTDLVVDALYGTGFYGSVNEKVARVIELINVSRVPVLAVDIPSGLEADTGRANGPCIRAHHTVTFGLPKIGLVVEPGASYAGKLHVVDISLPKTLTESKEISRQLLTREMIAPWFKPRQSEAHKGTYGRVVVVAGSRGMTGAARMAAKAALRAGAGLVTLALPESSQPVAAAATDEAMTRGLPETPAGTLALAALDPILAACGSADVLVTGPGIGSHPETVELIRTLLPKLTIPVVLDADALNAVAGAADLLAKLQVPAILTPHPGEMSRLLDLPVAEVQENRLDLARAAAKKWNLVAVLKGARTVIGAPDGSLFINPTGNPGMATAGSGDILAGLIAGLLAQGFSPEQAAAAGVYLHGSAGDLAADRLGQPSTIAGDILESLPKAMQTVMNKTCGQ